MAKHKVKMSCGHTETIQLFGKMTDREKRIAWLEEHGTCTACYKARKDAAHAEETAAAKAKADEENLPNLTGSEKQIKWALAIRAKKFEALDNRLAEMNTKTDEQQQRKNQIACQAARNVLARKTESRFWIDNRNVDALRLIANNNLQDDFKTEFARLTAEAEAENNNTNDAIIAAIDDYKTTAEAFDEAVNAEIEAAANNTKEETKMTNINTNDAIIAASDEQAAHIANQYKQMRKFAYKLVSVEYLTNSQVNSILVAIYADNADAEQVKRLVDKFNADNDRYIDACAKTIKNILDDEDKRAKLDNTNVFDLLPSVDELNDVDEEPTAAPPTIDDELTPELIVETKITARDSVILKVDGKRASRATAEEKIYANDDFTLINEFGKVFDGYVTHDGALQILCPEGNSLRFANVDTMVDHLAFDNIFHDEPTDDEPEPTTEEPTENVPDTIAAIAETCAELNANAPSGWEIRFDSDLNQFPVEYNGLSVAKLDSLATLNFLSPHDFFNQFRPLIDKNYTLRQQFIDDRQREMDELLIMRDELGNDTERLKMLDDMIAQLQRDIFTAEIAE